MESKYSSRKFIVAMSVLASATWLVAEKLIADGVYSAVAISVASVYLAANVTQKKLTS